MIRQETTYYDNYNIKTLSEYSEGVLVSYGEFNEQGKIILNNIIDEYEEKFEYDKKHRMVRWSCVYSTKEISWKTFSYSKDKMTILHRRIGNPPQIHKMVFGPDENGGLVMISEKFL